MDDRRLVWYVAYGSNMHAARLRCYLAGGSPPGTDRVYPGCRDASEPVRSAGVVLPGCVYFATESAVWSGGRAFYDPSAPGVAYARAHLVGAGQFGDIVAQEMEREPGTDPDVGLDLDDVVARGRVALGPGRYETLVCAGALDGVPLLTFTAPWNMADVPPLAPSAAYVRHLAAGLHETGTWGPDEIAGYLAGRPGAAGHWAPEQVLALLDPDAAAQA
ncbi:MULTISPECIES: histone deacetylase [Streptomyces]|uniref:Histone deacetylase n=1 Tax=Streptomyces solicathayae TaxID=3081768 RepID=A0ABZ0LUL8_9ACTN|nr:histone deacetylase [Streptomyces sp. HUAS YS2]WOX23122.1 histone deacetylase [Streptomyces sp. HUAS YS2]